MLTMRPTGLASPAYQDRQDWTILDEGKPVGGIYEGASASTSVDMRWTWSITVRLAGCRNRHERKGANTRPGEGEFRRSWTRASRAASPNRSATPPKERRLAVR